MRIAFDHQAFCLQKTGGISRYFFRLIEELDRLQQDVRVFAPLHRNQYATKLSAGLMHGRYIKNFPPYCASAAVSLNGMIARPQIRAWHPDVVHETYFSNACSGNSKQPIVLTVFDMIPELGLDGTIVTQQALKNSTKYAAARRADHIICISEQTRKDLIRLFEIDPARTSTIHLGCDVWRPFARKDVVEVDEVRAAKPYLLYVGLRTGYKNFNRFLQAVASSQIIKTSFDVIAFGGGRFDATEQSLITSLGFAQNQVCQISGDDESLVRYYSEASAFIYPSCYEGFGLPPLEAMNLQCPVVSSDKSALPEVIGDAAEYFDPLDVDSMRMAIENVVLSSVRSEDLIAKGVARAAVFTWSTCAGRHLSLYQHLLDKDVSIK